VAESLKAHVVIVGAGVAGMLVAWKLAQAGVQVLVLEAGPPVNRAEGKADQHPDAAPVVAVIITPVAGVELINQGRELYTANCAPCHQANGEGILNTFPALNGNPFVLTEDPFPAIYTVLHGRELMPSFEGALSGRQIAAILSYVRNAWDNQAPVVSAEQVQGVQEADDTGSEMAQGQ